MAGGGEGGVAVVAVVGGGELRGEAVVGEDGADLAAAGGAELGQDKQVRLVAHEREDDLGEPGGAAAVEDVPCEDAHGGSARERECEGARVRGWTLLFGHERTCGCDLPRGAGEDDGAWGGGSVGGRGGVVARGAFDVRARGERDRAVGVGEDRCRGAGRGGA